MHEALKRHMLPEKTGTGKKSTKAGKAALRRNRHIISTIVGKYQTTVPPEIRELFKLQEGDLLEWNFDPSSKKLVIIPMRPQSLISQAGDEEQDAPEITEPAERNDANAAQEEESVLVAAWGD